MLSKFDRRRAAVVAGHTQDPDQARRLVGDESAAVRSSARRALARLGVLSKSDLEAALTDTDPAARRVGAMLAAVRPDVAIVALLGDVEPTVVEVAAWACGERPCDRATVERLVEITGHSDPLVREAAVAALGALGDPAGLAAILAATRDKPAIRRRAVLALAPFDGPDVEAALEKARGDRDWQVRQAAEDLA